MLPIKASKLLIAEGIEADPQTRVRAERLRAGIETDDCRTVNDADLAAILRREVGKPPHHGMRDECEPVVAFTRVRFDDDGDEDLSDIVVQARIGLGAYGGFDWRDMGSPRWRERTGLVCQPAWQIHTAGGCHFRCAYCSFGRFMNLVLNIEEIVSHLDGLLARAPGQRLFQWDNGTDVVCFEPEYGAARLLIEYFARQPGRALELYAGKSDQIDFLLDYDHRGHTVCSWSLSGRTQSAEFEWRSAGMEQRIEAMRTCQAAGYPVRVRFSPIIPIKGWRDENREMIDLLFRDVTPDVVTMETIRYLDYDEISRHFDLGLLDEAFVSAMREDQGRDAAPGCQVPAAWRKQVYRFIFDELDRVSPETPVAFCREERTLWDHFAADLARRGQHPDRYRCNCGPTSAPVTVMTG